MPARTCLYRLWNVQTGTRLGTYRSADAALVRARKVLAEDWHANAGWLQIERSCNGEGMVLESPEGVRMLTVQYWTKHKTGPFRELHA